MEAQAKGNWESARQSYQKAVDLDPQFALGYQGLAAMARNQGRLGEIDENVQKALKFLPNLTERERLTTRGFYYWATGDNSQCVKEHNELLSRYTGDVLARTMLAICLKNLRNMRGATDEMRQAVKVLPNHVILRTNLALFTNFAGEFEIAEREATAISPPTRPSILALAYSQIGRGLVTEAKQTYERLATTDARGMSLVASGVGDVLVYEGRFSEAIATFERGAAADISAKNPDRAAIKYTSIANAFLMSGPKGRSRALAAAEKALANSKAAHVRFLSARILVEAGVLDTAKQLAAELSSAPNVWGGTAVHGKIIEAGIALKTGNPEHAITLLTEANATLDTWFAHYDLGRAYMAAGKLVQADSEFDTCIRRSGEAILLMDEDPTYGYFPPVYYYQGQVREKQGMAGFADSYGKYRDIRRGSTEDPLLAEVLRKVGG
jgi:tetratricopeptide (TPR) repeat protein